MVTDGPLLCPACRKLISGDEPACPYCGLPKPGSRSKYLGLSRLFRDGETLVGILIGANAAMYLLCLLMSRGSLQLTANPMAALSPDSRTLLLLGATGVVPIDQLHRWWTLLSASYLHGGILHIVFNMLALRQISPLIVREYGTHRMFAIYTFSGAGGFLLSYTAGVPFTIGASAAVCGLIGAALYYGKSRGGIYGQTVYRQVGGWALGIFLFGAIVPGINNWAHGGGMAAGIMLGLVLGYHERRRENRIHRLTAGLCLIGTASVLLWAVAGGALFRV